MRDAIRTAVRHLVRNKTHSLLNIFGLAVSFTCCLLMSQYIWYELTYDSFHENAGRIYRVVETMKRADGFERTRPFTGTPLGRLARQNAAGIDKIARFTVWDGIVRVGNRLFREERFAFVDPQFLDIFSFPLVDGEAAEVFNKPNAVLLTESMARKLFGDADPVGESVTFRDDMTLTVAGVLRDPPANSHFKFDFVASIDDLLRAVRGYAEHWDAAVATYVIPTAGIPVRGLEAQLNRIAADNFRDNSGTEVTYSLERLRNIHLVWESSQERLYLFGALALFVLILAVVNYINFSTAVSARYAREVGVKKAIGASRWQLVRQYLGRSVLLSIVAAVLAVVLAELSIGRFNDLAGTQLTFSYRYLVPVLFGFAVVVGLAAGWYPALHLTSIKPVNALRKQLSSRGTGGRLRSVLVVFQFGVAVTLIITALVAHDQLAFLRQKDLGFDKENVIVISLEEGEIKRDWRAVKSDFKSVAGVEGVTLVSNVPGGPDCYGISYALPGTTQLQSIPTVWVDDDYLATMRIKLVEGRSFSQERGDEKRSFIVNEAAMKMAGISSLTDANVKAYFDPSGNEAPVYEGPIIGVVEDFHFRYLKNRLQPLVLVPDPDRGDFMLIRLAAGNQKLLIEELKSIWLRHFEPYPLEFRFLDETIDQQYWSEERFSSIVRYASLLAIFVAGLGLFGLTSFIVEGRVKEIGIRRVMGAPVLSIVVRLSREFLALVLLANVIAIPIALLLMRHWLENFVYRTEVTWVTVLSGVLISAFVAVSVIMSRTVKAARAKPVDTLRHE